MVGHDSARSRRSIRLRNHDYSQSGAYFVTICVQDRLCLFGDVVEGEVRRNASGDMVLRWWHELERKYPHILLDDIIVMPNHLHGIILIDQQNEGRKTVQPGLPLGTIVGWLKAMSTNEYIRNVPHSGWEPFRGRLWQRNYFEHIIRSERAHERLRRYITANPSRWALDEEHPDRYR